MLVPERRRERHFTHRTSYSAEPQTRSLGAGLELYAWRKGGTEFPVEISLRPLETDDGMLVSSMIRDITDAGLHRHDRARGVAAASPASGDPRSCRR